jgi:hypothetical protein
MYEFFSKLSLSKAIKIGFIAFGLIVAPNWFVFQFAYYIYSKNDIFQNLLIALAIGMPVCIIHYFLDLVSRRLFDDEKSSTIDDNELTKVAYACCICGFVFYMPNIVQFFKGSMSQANAIWWVFSGNFGLWVTPIFRIIKFAVKDLFNHHNKKVHSN